ncbi:hypothetical protein GFL15_24700 [Rhizobium leguminosarum bv. viciae]|nr:hypothetical protein [Rhizobium leguminosarum bv. viciae]
MSLWAMFPFCLDRVALMSVSQRLNESDLQYHREAGLIQLGDGRRSGGVVDSNSGRSPRPRSIRRERTSSFLISR